MMYFTPDSIPCLIRLSDIFQRDQINIPLNNLLIQQPYVVMIYWLIPAVLAPFVLKVIKANNIRRGVINAMSIMVMYLACVVIYTYEPAGLQRFLSPLPFVEFEGNALKVIVFRLGEKGLIDVPYLCSQILSMLILAYMVNQIYNYDNANLKNTGWFYFRCITTAICIAVYYGINYGLNVALSYVPADSNWMELLKFAPIGILFTILVLYILGSIKTIMAKMLKMMNPTFEGLNGFFYKNKFGVVLNRAMWSTATLTAFAWSLQNALTKLNADAALTLGTFPGFTGIIILIALFFIWIILGHSA